MRRMHLIEIHEQPWCPASLRDALTDYLQFAIESGNPYGGIVERLKQSVLRARATRIVDLCSGGGGRGGACIGNLRRRVFRSKFASPTNTRTLPTSGWRRPRAAASSLFIQSRSTPTAFRVS